jgi:hypothetical protein
MPPQQVPLERLEAEITELAGHLTASECRWVLLIAEYDRRAGYEEWACRSCAHWLSWHCSLDLRAARERVRVGRALESLPLITSEFATGALSYSKVRALTRVATPTNESALVDLAKGATAAHVERAIQAYRRVLSADDEKKAANERHAARFLRYEWDDEGSLRGSFRIPPEMAAIFLAAISTARERVPADPEGENGPAGPSDPFAATNVDALTMMAEAFLASAPAASRGDRFQIVVNADLDVLGEGAEGTCALDDGPALAPETVRRLACDASIVIAVHDAVDRLVGTSKKAPAIPASTRRAIRRRDKGCRFPGCGGRAFTQIHHVKHRAKFGGNEMTNLVELCWFHHRLVHEGGWSVRMEASGEVLAIRPNGNVLPRPKATTPCDGHEVERANRSRGIAIDPTTCIPRWYGDPLNLKDIVSSLVSMEPH